MPELPEVETVRRSLIKHLIGRTIEEVECFCRKLFAIWRLPNFRKAQEPAVFSHRARG